jgi:uncharacterized protein YndB with AHSA1/START domain
MAAPAHVYEIFIRATPETVWNALTDPDCTTRYFHRVRYESTFEGGAPYRQVLPDGRLAVDGVIETFEPPRRLVMTWHVLYDAAMSEEPPSRVEWTLVPANDDGTVTRVTLRHGDLGASPLTWANVRLGWVGVLDGLKTLLETGESLGDVDTSSPAAERADAEAEWHRMQAIEANNSAWELLERSDRTADDDEDLLRRAYAAAHHWARAAGRGPANEARAAWLQSRVWVVTGDGTQALRYAERCAAVCAEHGLVDFDLAFAHEARARALACLGRHAEADDARAAAASVPIAEDEDRAVFETDLAGGPWFELVTSA